MTHMPSVREYMKHHSLRGYPITVQDSPSLYPFETIENLLIDLSLRCTIKDVERSLHHFCVEQGYDYRYDHGAFFVHSSFFTWCGVLTRIDDHGYRLTTIELP